MCGSQPFEIYEFDALGNLTVIDEGRTAPFRVPEPALAGLLGLSGLAFLARRIGKIATHTS